MVKGKLYPKNDFVTVHEFFIPRTDPETAEARKKLLNLLRVRSSIVITVPRQKVYDERKWKKGEPRWIQAEEGKGGEVGERDREGFVVSLGQVAGRQPGPLKSLEKMKGQAIYRVLSCLAGPNRDVLLLLADFRFNDPIKWPIFPFPVIHG